MTRMAEAEHIDPAGLDPSHVEPGPGAGAPGMTRGGPGVRSNAREAVMDIRKLIVQRETVLAEGGGAPERPVNRVAGIGVLANPFAGRFVEDLSELFDMGFALGERLMAEMVPLLGSSASRHL